MALSMYEWINKQGVTSSDGFTVQRMHRYYYHYIEGEHVLRVVVEPCRDPDTRQYSEIVAEDSFAAWQPPHDNEPLTPERSAEIRLRFFDALSFMEIEHRSE
jgi:hypothetical protein